MDFFPNRKIQINTIGSIWHDLFVFRLVIFLSPVKIGVSQKNLMECSLATYLLEKSSNRTVTFAHVFLPILPNDTAMV